MPEVLQVNLPVSQGGRADHSVELGDDDCFEPVIPTKPEAEPVPQPRQPSLGDLMDKVLLEMGIEPRTRTEPDLDLSTSSPVVASADVQTAQPSEIPPAVVEQLPPPRVATATEVVSWIKRVLQAQTHLSDAAAQLVAFWVISTWFPDALAIHPCLVITGSAHTARTVLHLLHGFCCSAALLAGFKRSHLRALRRHWTNLVWEPNLDKRTADLLGNMTDRDFRIAEGESLTRYAMSTAIYAGENPLSHKIENAIHIHISPTTAAPPPAPRGLQTMINRIPVHLSQYREKNLSHVQHWTWVPEGLSPETAAIATSLGKGIVHAPELQQMLVPLLKTQDQECLYEMSNTPKATVVEATWALIREGRKYAYASEIATKANGLREARGETARLGPENVGHLLKSLGLPTHRISQAGNGLTFDTRTVAEIQQLVAMYVMEDMPEESENLHGAQTTENN